MRLLKWAGTLLLIIISTFLLSFRSAAPSVPLHEPATAAVSSATAPVSPDVAGSATVTTAATLASTDVTRVPTPARPAARLTRTWPTATQSPSAAVASLTMTPISRMPTATSPVHGGLPTATAGPSPAANSTPEAGTPAPTSTLPVSIDGVNVSITEWPFDTRADLPRYLYIDQNLQHMYVFENGALIRDIPCSTGLPYSNTYTPAWSGVVGEYWGTFYAFDVYADGAWYLFKSDGSILIHSLPYTITVSEGPKEYLEADALGVRPASHGCIRISPEDIEWFRQWNPEGVPITITGPYRDKWLPLLGAP